MCEFNRYFTLYEIIDCVSSLCGKGVEFEIEYRLFLNRYSSHYKTDVSSKVILSMKSGEEEGVVTFYENRMFFDTVKGKEKMIDVINSLKNCLHMMLEKTERATIWLEVETKVRKLADLLEPRLASGRITEIHASVMFAVDGKEVKIKEFCLEVVNDAMDYEFKATATEDDVWFEVTGDEDFVSEAISLFNDSRGYVFSLNG